MKHQHTITNKSKILKIFKKLGCLHKRDLFNIVTRLSSYLTSVIWDRPLGNPNMLLGWSWGTANMRSDLMCWIDLEYHPIDWFNDSTFSLISSNTRSLSLIFFKIDSTCFHNKMFLLFRRLLPFMRRHIPPLVCALAFHLRYFGVQVI